MWQYSTISRFVLCNTSIATADSMVLLFPNCTVTVTSMSASPACFATQLFSSSLEAEDHAVSSSFTIPQVDPISVDIDRTVQRLERQLVNQEGGGQREEEELSYQGDDILPEAAEGMGTGKYSTTYYTDLFFFCVVRSSLSPLPTFPFLPSTPPPSLFPPTFLPLPSPSSLFPIKQRQQLDS